MTSELVPWSNESTRVDNTVGSVPRLPEERPPVPGAPARSMSVLLPTGSVRRPSGPYIRLLKPLLDRSVAAVGIVVAAVPMVAVAGVVALAMGRPVLFRQRRIGLDGQEFEMLKFRTMGADRRCLTLDVIHDRRRTHKSADDPRHTSIGRFLRRTSLDELPQLFNVLRGEMSIVGPRPELVAVVEHYPPALHQRHQVKPGLTGLWQVSARGAGPMHENGQWDLAYIQSVSLRTDVRIIARTPSAILGENSGS